MSSQKIAKKKRGNITYELYRYSGDQYVIYKYDEGENDFTTKAKQRQKLAESGNEKRAKELWEKL